MFGEPITEHFQYFGDFTNISRIEAELTIVAGENIFHALIATTRQVRRNFSTDPMKYEA